jgi:serine/threonine-protein kinase
MKDPRQASEARVGETLNNKWHLDRLIDIGGMAAVYEATHRNGKKAAVKLLHPEVAAEPQIKERFLREGYVANKVDHPGSVSVLDDDSTPDGAVFLVMELLIGESLDQRLKRMGGRLGVVETLAVADQVLGVLAAAHAKGVIHRDIKPGNLFLTREGRVKVLDFGLARLRDGSSVASAPTATGVILGTYQYMPHEQARGKSELIDGRTDIFAVGAVMFRTLTGQYVHTGENVKEILLSAIMTRPRSLGEVAKTMPKCVVDVVDKAIAYDMASRWPDATSMETAVREAYAELAEHAKVSVDIPIDVKPDDELSSVVVDVAFGEHDPKV